MPPGLGVVRGTPATAKCNVDIARKCSSCGTLVIVEISRDTIDRTLATKHGEAAYTIIEKLLDAGYEAWWVGGAVRDMLLSEIPHDIDITTSALPDAICALFPKNDDSDKDLGAVRVPVSGTTFEITTFREDDTTSDGRHPESVRFGDRTEDALRRDATVNAIYWNPVSREYFDPCDGRGDLEKGLVRFIGDPVLRIRHDALRIFRMVRLRAAIDGQYEKATRDALAELSSLSADLSGMRILQEVEKMLKGKRIDLALEDLWELGVLKAAIPELHECKGVAQPKQYHQEGDVFEHLKRCTTVFTEDHGADVRLAGLLHDIGKTKTFSVKERIRFDHHAEVSATMANAFLLRCQAPASRREKISWMIEHHMMMNAFATLTEVRKAHWYFHPWFQELLQLFWIDAAGTVPGDFKLYDAIIKDYNEFLNAHPRPEKPLLNGDEIMEILGVGPGEEVGRLRKELHDAQVSKRISSKAEARVLLSSLRKESSDNIRN